jgi:hypothetical protein
MQQQWWQVMYCLHRLVVQATLLLLLVSSWQQYHVPLRFYECSGALGTCSQVKVRHILCEKHSKVGYCCCTVQCLQAMQRCSKAVKIQHACTSALMQRGLQVFVCSFDSTVQATDSNGSPGRHCSNSKCKIQLQHCNA